MKSQVYFASIRARRFRDNKVSKVKRLYEAVKPENFFSKNQLVALKLHFGEMGNDTFLNPVFVRAIVDLVKAEGGKPFLTDTNTLYLGSRKNAVDHLETALRHGFGYAATNAPIIIADGLTDENYAEVKIEKKHFTKAYIAGAIQDAHSMVVLSHFKGHEMAGFGGAIKNLAMGCANARGKKEQHSTRPVADPKKCIGCGACLAVCPEDAITLVGGKAVIDGEACIGCGECMTVCPVKAIILDWSSELLDFTEKMVEYAYAAVKDKPGRVLYINFLLNITPDCDCVPWSDAPLVPDIGILASTDPVAIDQASLDLVSGACTQPDCLFHETVQQGEVQDSPSSEDLFTKMRRETLGQVQLSYGKEIGLGSREYELIEI